MSEKSQYHQRQHFDNTSKLKIRVARAVESMEQEDYDRLLHKLRTILNQVAMTEIFVEIMEIIENRCSNEQKGSEE